MAFRLGSCVLGRYLLCTLFVGVSMVLSVQVMAQEAETPSTPPEGTKPVETNEEPILLPEGTTRIGLGLVLYIPMGDEQYFLEGQTQESEFTAAGALAFEVLYQRPGSGLALGGNLKLGFGGVNTDLYNIGEESPTFFEFGIVAEFYPLSPGGFEPYFGVGGGLSLFSPGSFSDEEDEELLEEGPDDYTFLSFYLGPYVGLKFPIFTDSEFQKGLDENENVVLAQSAGLDVRAGYNLDAWAVKCLSRGGEEVDSPGDDTLTLNRLWFSLSYYMMF